MNKLTVLCGLPGSGKSTIAKSILKEEMETEGFVTKIFSSDAIREELYGDANILGNHQEVFELLEKRIIAFFRANPDGVAIYDATNLIAKKRRELIKRIAKNAVCLFECIFVACRLSQCKRRQYTRDRQVPEEVIERMARQFQAPFYNEGWDEINIIAGGPLYDLNEEVLNAWGVSHDNMHHSLTIGQHMSVAGREAAKLVDEMGWGGNAVIAARYHDLGKPHTKVFTNYKGEPTTEAHYYSHENVSGYMWLCANHEREAADNVLIIGSLIQWHMIPYFIKPKGEAASFEELSKWTDKHGFNNEYAKLLWVVHLADKAAH